MGKPSRNETRNDTELKEQRRAFLPEHLEKASSVDKDIYRYFTTDQGRLYQLIVELCSVSNKLGFRQTHQDDTFKNRRDFIDMRLREMEAEFLTLTKDREEADNAGI